MEIRNRNKFLGIDDYDDRGNVKTGLFLQFALVYFSRFLLYGPISLLAGRGLRYDVSFFNRCITSSDDCLDSHYSYAFFADGEAICDKRKGY